MCELANLRLLADKYNVDCLKFATTVELVSQSFYLAQFEPFLAAAARLTNALPSEVEMFYLWFDSILPFVLRNAHNNGATPALDECFHAGGRFSVMLGRAMSTLREREAVGGVSKSVTARRQSTGAGGSRSDNTSSDRSLKTLASCSTVFPSLASRRRVS